MGRHFEWRKIAKKCRRSRLRKLKAAEKEKILKDEEQKNLKSFSYSTWQKEQEALELFARIEEQRIQEEENRNWIERELQAQGEWKQSQEKIAAFKAEKVQQEIRIREEWDREQKRIREIEERNQREKEHREKQEKEFKERIDDFIAGACNELPPGFKTSLETKPDKTPCPFYSKVAACRFFDHCSRNHIRPSVSKTLLLNNFFMHFSMENKSVAEYDTDMSLETDETEMYKYFVEFYEDVMPEIRVFGKVTQFKVCCNLSHHLKGNVYVSYSSEREALKAYYALTGRYYGGKRIRAQFCHVPVWESAICGLFQSKKCPKGGLCNFLHVFRNPTSEFAQADHDRVTPRNNKSSIRSSSWAWSSDSDNENDSANGTERNRGKARRRSRSRHRDGTDSHSYASERKKRGRNSENTLAYRPERRSRSTSNCENGTKNRSERRQSSSRERDKQWKRKRRKRSPSSSYERRKSRYGSCDSDEQCEYKHKKRKDKKEVKSKVD